jgi:hypothetical protein
LGTGKVTVQDEGTLNLTLPLGFDNLDDVRKAFTTVENGSLNISVTKPFKPSDIVALSPNEKRTITIKVSGAETVSSLNIPVGLTLTAMGDLTAVTDLTVNGDFTASGALPTTAGALSVNVAAGASLSLNKATLASSTIIGDLVLIGDVTLDTDAVLTIVDPSTVSGTAAIIAETTGSITLGSESDAVAGFTTVDTGIVGDDLVDAVAALEEDYYLKLTNSIGLDWDTFEFEPGNAIGTVMVIAANAAAAVTRNEFGAGTGAPVVFDADADLVPIGTGPIVPIIRGKNSTGTNTPAIAAGDFDFTWTAGALEVGDTGWIITAPKYIVLTFEGYRLANNGLITPEDWSVPFSIGVQTGRTS